MPTVQVNISKESNAIITAELDKLNEGKSNRRSDPMVTKAQICSRIIDTALGVNKK